MKISNPIIPSLPPSGILWYVDFIYKSDRIQQLEDLQRKIDKIKNDTEGI